MLLLGFIAMHGLTAGQASGAHQHAVASVGVAGAPGADVDHLYGARAEVGHDAHLGTGSGASAAAVSPVDHYQNVWMTGCMLALTGLVTLVLVVQALGVMASMARRPEVSVWDHRHVPSGRPARSRGRPFLLLCILRV